MLLAACLPIPPGENRAQPSEPAAPVASPSPVAAASPVAPPAAAPASPPPPPPILAFDDAVSAAAHKVFAGAPTPDGAAAVIVIDPLVDGMTGYQSKATKSIQDRIAVVVKSDFPQYVVKRITPDNLKPGPRILVGTFTP